MDQTFEDKLDIQLMECAILVKKGERMNPLVLDTLEKLRLFVQAETTTDAAAATAKQEVVATRAVSPTGSAKERGHQHGENKLSNSSVGSGGTGLKPLGNVFGKMIGIGGGEETKKTAEQKKATSEKNAARVKADLAAEMNASEQPQHHHGSWLPFLHSSEDST
jgi:hypothetical protein